MEDPASACESPRARRPERSEVKHFGVRMVLDHASEYPWRWAAVTSIAAKIGCTPQTLHDWVKKTGFPRRFGSRPVSRESVQIECSRRASTGLPNQLGRAP